MEAPDPAHGPQRDIHRAGPVHAVRQRVGRDPVGRFGDELRGVAVVAGEPVRLAKSREVLASAELPRHLHVGGTIELVVFDVAAVGERPLAACLEIREPRQRGAE